MKQPLSHQELQVLSDSSFLLMKQQITEKMIANLASIERALHTVVNNSKFPFPKSTFLKAGKISKGDSYRSLPYFVLDYPRLFTPTKVFAYRTMLWWGHEFSCTLHLAGSILQEYFPRLEQNFHQLEDHHFCIHSTPWEYHFEPDNFVPVKTTSSRDLQTHAEKYGFVKLSARLPLQEWQRLEAFTLDTFNRFLSVLT